MKNAIDLMEHLRAQGVELYLAGDSIRFRGADGVLTPEIKDRMKEHRSEIIAHLRQEIVRTGQGGLVVVGVMEISRKSIGPAESAKWPETMRREGSSRTPSDKKESRTASSFTG
jgi:hypothetical protein